MVLVCMFIHVFDLGNGFLTIHYLRFANDIYYGKTKQFANDTILLFTVDNHDINNVFNLVRLFEEASGLNINQPSQNKNF